MARFPAGERLRNARIAAKMTPEEVAVAVGRSAVSINGYELGRIEPPIHVLAQIAAVCGVSLGDILDPCGERVAVGGHDD
jgi:transcriptional regulator with XRE-family HTH domain